MDIAIKCYQNDYDYNINNDSYDTGDFAPAKRTGIFEKPYHHYIDNRGYTIEQVKAIFAYGGKLDIDRNLGIVQEFANSRGEALKPFIDGVYAKHGINPNGPYDDVSVDQLRDVCADVMEGYKTMHKYNEGIYPTYPILASGPDHQIVITEKGPMTRDQMQAKGIHAICPQAEPHMIVSQDRKNEIRDNAIKCLIDAKEQTKMMDIKKTNDIDR